MGSPFGVHYLVERGSAARGIIIIRDDLPSSGGIERVSSVGKNGSGSDRNIAPLRSVAFARNGRYRARGWTVYRVAIAYNNRRSIRRPVWYWAEHTLRAG